MNNINSYSNFIKGNALAGLFFLLLMVGSTASYGQCLVCPSSPVTADSELGRCGAFVNVPLPSLATRSCGAANVQEETCNSGFVPWFLTLQV